MTKHVSALILVLLMAPAANAALVLTIDDNPVPWDADVVGTYLGLYTDTPIAGYDVGFVASGDVTMDWVTPGITYPLVFELQSSIVGTPTPTNLRISSSQLFGPHIGPGDLVANITLSGTGTIFLFDVFGAMDIGSINIVPEPASIFLIGFGGFALLRKRRG